MPPRYSLTSTVHLDKDKQPFPPVARGGGGRFGGGRGGFKEELHQALIDLFHTPRTWGK